MAVDYGLVYVGAGIACIFIAIFVLDWLRRLARPAAGINLGPVEVEMRYGNSKLQKTLKGDLVESSQYLSKDVQTDAKSFIIESIPGLLKVNSVPANQPQNPTKALTVVGAQEQASLAQLGDSLKQYPFEKVCRVYFLHESFAKEKHMIIQVSHVDKVLLDLAVQEVKASWSVSSGKANKAKLRGIGLSFPIIQPTPFGSAYVHLFDPDDYTRPRQTGDKTDDDREKLIVDAKPLGELVPWLPTITDIKQHLKAKDSIIKGTKEALANMGYELKVKSVGEDAYHVAISSMSRHGQPAGVLPKKFDTKDFGLITAGTFIFALIGASFNGSWGWIPGLFFGLILTCSLVAWRS